MEIPLGKILQVLENIHLFRGVSPEDLEGLAAHFKAVAYSAGQVISAQDDPANTFFVVYTGSVEVHQTLRRNKDQHLLTLDSSEYFGVEGLTLNQTYASTATAVGPVVVLQLDQAGISDILATYPVVIPQFKLAAQTYAMLLRTPLTWRKPSEVVYYFSRRDLVILFGKWFYPALMAGMPSLLLLLFFAALQSHPIWLVVTAGIFLLVGIVWALWLWLDWSNDYYIVTNHRVVYQEKVVLLYDSTQETPLEAILSLNVKSDFWGRQFGFGDITIKTYTGTLLFKQVHDPIAVQQLIDSEWLHAKLRRQHEEQKTMRAVLQSWFKGEKTTLVSAQADEAVASKVVSGSLSSFLAQFFQLRIERGGDIIYRTHWWILLKKIWAPTLCILLVFLLAVLRVTDVLPLFSVGGILAGVLAVEIGLLLWWTYQYVDWSNDIYVISGDQLVDINRTPLGTEERRSAPIRNIQSMDYSRVGLIGILFNFGTVSVLIGTEKFTFDLVYNPSSVQREIFNRFMQVTRQSQMAEQQRMADWIQAYNSLYGDEDTP
jgi:hypothetical protein